MGFYVPGDETSLPVEPQGVDPNLTPAAPSIGETAGAAFRQNNTVVSLYQRLQDERFPEVPGYTPMEYPGFKGSKYEQNYRDNFTYDKSPQETEQRMRHIDQEEQDQRTLDAAGGAGTVLGIVAGTIDPTLALPAGEIVKVAGGGYSLVRSAARVAAAAAGQAAAQEGILQRTQETRKVEQSLFSIGSATVLGGILGAAASKLLTVAERNTMIHSLDNMRTELNEHAGNPIPEANVPRPAPVELKTEGNTLRGETPDGRAVAYHVVERDGNFLVSREEQGGAHVESALPERSGYLQEGGGYFKPAEERPTMNADPVRVFGSREDAELAIHEDNMAVAAHVPGGTSMPGAGGGAVSDTRELKMRSSIPKTDFMSTTRRVFSRESVRARRTMADLAENPYWFEDQFQGKSVTTGPPLDRMARMAIDGTSVRVTDKLKSLFAEHRFGDAEKKFPGATAQFEKFTGKGPTDGISTMGDFKQAVFDAMLNQDQHAIPQVASAASYIREQVFKPWADRAIALSKKDTPGFEGFQHLTDEQRADYFTRIWNKEAIRAKRPEVVRRFADWYQQDQAVKAKIRERLVDHSGELKDVGQKISKFEGMLESLDVASGKTAARLNERAMEAKRTGARTDALAQRTQTLQEDLADIKQFIDETRKQVRDPVLLDRLDSMEREAAELRKADKPMTEAQMRKLDDEELKGILTGQTRMAAEMIAGRRAYPKAPSFLSWVVSNGGVKDLGGDVAHIMGGTRGRPGLINARGRELDSFGEMLQEEFPHVFQERPTPRDVLDFISEASHGRDPSWWVERHSEAHPDVVAAGSLATALTEAFDRAGVQVRNIRDVARALRGEAGNVTLEDLDKIAADMEAVGQNIPASIKRENADQQVEITQQSIKDMRDLIQRSMSARDAKMQRIKIAEARGKEAGMAERANVGRLGVLDERLSRQEARRELLIDALEISKRQSDVARKRIEEELAAWQGTSAQEAKSAIRAREKYELEQGREAGAPRLKMADSAVDRTVRRIVNSKRDLSFDEHYARAQETVDRILSSPDGRLPYDAPQGGPMVGPPRTGSPPRGSLNARDFAIPNKMVSDLIEHDVEHVAGMHLRTMVPDVMLAERFGDVDLTRQFKEINEEYSAKVDAANSEAQRIKLDKERIATIEDLAATRDRIRGTFSSAPEMRNLARISNAMKTYNNLTSMGMSAISSIPDFAGAVVRYGFTATMQDGWVPYLRALSGDNAAWKASKEQWRAVGVGVESALNARQHSLDDMQNIYANNSRAERVLQYANDKFFVANLLAPLTDLQKTISANVSAAGILKASKAVADGKATSTQIAMLANSNIEAPMAREIWNQYQNGGGSVVGGIHLPNTGDWTNKTARTTFEAAVARDVDIMVITPGNEKPLWMSRPVFGILGQFKTFTAAANEKLLIANIQRRDASVLAGIGFYVSLGMLGAKINSVLGGQSTDNYRIQDWFKEGVNRGLGDWFEEGNAVAAKATGGALDMYRLIGADKPFSRYASRSTLDMFLGPTAGKLEDMLHVAGSAAKAAAGAAGVAPRGLETDWRASDSRALRRLVATQNLLYLRNAYNEVEKGLNGKFGIQ